MSLDAFHHEALFYSGDADFLIGTLPFIRQGLELGEAVLVVEREARASLLRRELGDDASAVMFADMDAVGANPARIIPTWQEFVERHDLVGGGMRGIGEPIWAARPEDELVECQRHESLLNVAFAPGRPWRLLCPYDTDALPAPVIDEARRSHPYVSERHVQLPSPNYRGLAESGASFSGPLRPAPDKALSLTFGPGGLAEVRRLVSREAAHAALDVERLSDLVAAANEVATNSLRHGGGAGSVLVWTDADSVFCEVRDRGRFSGPLADRERPAGMQGPRGLWFANQVCDLVQIRSYPTGTVVRLVMRRRRRHAA